jgi:hypothetical protein
MAWGGGHSHRDAHPGEDAVRRRGHNLQPLRDQRCSAVEVWLEVDELLFETVAVGLETAKTRPFGASIAVAVPVSVGVNGEGWIACQCKPSYKVKDVTQPKDSGSTTVFSNDELLIPRPRRHRLLTLLLQPFTSTNSTSACCPSTPMCVMACANCITHTLHPAFFGADSPEAWAGP